MPSLRQRLREWWRTAYGVRGFGFLVPGFRRQRERDAESYFLDGIWKFAEGVYPDGTYVAVLRGQLVTASTPQELLTRLQIIMERVGIPGPYLPVMHLLGPRARMTFKRRDEFGGSASY
jgi:hypothetical protein